MMVPMLWFSLMIHTQYKMRVIDMALISETNSMKIETASNVYSVR